LSTWLLAAAAFGALAVLLLAGVPIAFAMIIVGVAGSVSILGLEPALALLGQIPVSQAASYELSVVPMFILMGAFVARSGIAADLYDACHALIGHKRGGLAMATIVACGGFAAVCGSSVATAATFSRVAHPSMRRYGYHEGLAAASICAGGTLGILIPPSVIMVLYGVMTGTDVARLFIAGLVPGVLAIVLYAAVIQVLVWRRPQAGPAAERVAPARALRAFAHVWPVLVLFALVIGGLYFGAFTATEGGAIGAAGAFLFALWRRALTWRSLLDCAIETARTTGALFAILIGALLFAQFMNFAGLPEALKEAVTAFGTQPPLVIGLILLLYVVLGTFFEELSMVLLTVPIFYPLVVSLGFDPVWFGIVIVMVVELGLISPPVGMNLFVVQSMLKTPLGVLWRWVTPFVLADVLRLAIVVAIPQIVLFLPGLMR
jgi:tripartite ATP-independent transporter DctM subunit